MDNHSGGVTSVTASSPIFSSGGTTPNITCQTASGSLAGCLLAVDWNTFNNKQPAGNYLTALTGDGTASGPGSSVFTLASVTTPGTSPKVTYNAKGLVTSGTTLSSGDIPNNSANTTGTSANVTAASNSTLTTLSALSLPYSQLTGAPSALTFNAPLSLSGNAVSISLATTSTPGYLSSTDWNTFNNKQAAGAYITALTGDATASGPGSSSLTFATVNSNTGSFGTASTIPSFTVNGKGLITAASNNTVTTLPSLNLPASQVTGLTSGSVVYSNGTSLTQDNANFFWNDSNVALGIGGSPQSASVLTTINSSGAAKPIWTFSYGTGSTTGVRGDMARGTVGSPTATQTGDVLNFFSGRGYGSSQFATASTGLMQIVAGENFTNSSNATYLAFKTTPTASVTSAEAMRINTTGNILVGTTTDNATDKVQVNGGVSLSYAKLQGSVSGNVQRQASATTTSYTITDPPAQGGVNTVAVNNGSGVMAWTSFPSPYLVSTISSNTNAVASTTYLCNTSGAAFTLTLPAPVSGAFVAIKDSTGSFGTNQLTVAPHGSEMIEGLAANKVLYTAWGAFSFFSDGTNWFMGPF